MTVEYKFIVQREDRQTLPQWENFDGNHLVTPVAGQVLQARSDWGSADIFTLSQAVTAVTGGVVFNVRCDATRFGEAVFVVGNHESLGAWSAAKAVALTCAESFPTWRSAPIQLPAGMTVEYKFIVQREDRQTLPQWENFDGNHLVTPVAGQVLQARSDWGSADIFTLSQACDQRSRETSKENGIEFALQGNGSSSMRSAFESRPRPSGCLLGNRTNFQKEFNPDAETPKPEPVVFDVVPQEVLDETFKSQVIGHMHGTLGGEHERVTYGAVPLKLPPLVASQKGFKGDQDRTPNQDNFSITYFKSGYTLVCVCDGHGSFGHLVSFRAVQTVPWFMIHDSAFNEEAVAESSFEKALKNAFKKAHEDAVASLPGKDWFAKTSGSTAVAALFKGNKVWTANAGDSRCIIASRSDNEVIFETEDHKPQSEKEKKRITSLGGQVRARKCPEGSVTYGVCLQGQAGPNLGMTRSLGDELLKNYGVTPVPEVVFKEINLTKGIFILIATDGIWEFITTKFALKAFNRFLPIDGPEKTFDRLLAEAHKRWHDNTGGEYRDDITSVLIDLQ